MHAKKFTFIFISFFLILYTVLYLLYYLVNPEQVFAHSLTEKKFFYTKEYSRKQFEKLKEKKYTLIFGTSQIHKISSKMMGSPVLNFHNLYGEPGDVINFLQQLDNKQIENIDKIIFCIDLSADPGRKEGALIDYYKPKFHYPILTKDKLFRLVQDIIYNNKAVSGHLNTDGSIEPLDPKEYHPIPAYPYEIVYPYDIKLIQGILAINTFALAHNKKIIFCTPVTSEAYLKKIDFLKLSVFFTALLDGGIKRIKLFYYIPNMTDLKNNKSEYLAFMDPQHLNTYFVKQWLDEYILTDNAYVISTHEELNLYIQQMRKIAESNSRM